MPFPSVIDINPKHTNSRNKLYKQRREVRFDFSHIMGLSCKREKASASISDGCSGSITIEMVVCVPLFLYASLCLIWLLEIRVIQTSVRSGLQAAGKEIASNSSIQGFLQLTELEEKMISAIGTERMDRSILVGGSGGLQCEKSYVIPGSGIYELKVKYQVKIPVPFFSIGAMTYEEGMRIKGWNGYKKEIFTEFPDKKMVYVTETGMVYHLDYHCNYLDLSIRGIVKGALEEERNVNGEKYVACPLCTKKGGSDRVYVTNYGNRYHGTLSCVGLKRKVYAVPIEEVKGKVVCSKCGN